MKQGMKDGPSLEASSFKGQSRAILSSSLFLLFGIEHKDKMGGGLVSWGKWPSWQRACCTSRRTRAWTITAHFKAGPVIPPLWVGWQQTVLQLCWPVSLASQSYIPLKELHWVSKSVRDPKNIRCGWALVMHPFNEKEGP